MEVLSSKDEEQLRREGSDSEPDSEWGKVTFLGRRMNKGGWKTSPFIFGNEVCEKLGAIGLQANLSNYLTEQLHFKSADAATTLTNFGGTASLTPILGAILADSYFGRYWVTLVGSLLFTLGTIILTAQAWLPSLRPNQQCPSDGTQCPHASPKQLGVLYLAFICMAAGSGGIRPCVAAFGADQFNEEDPKQREQIRHYFNWYYFTIQGAILVTVTLFVWIQEYVGWTLGFGIPAVLMLLSVVVFAAGAPIYRMVCPQGGPLTRLAQVVVACIRKRKLELPEDPCDLYELPEKLSSATRLLHTDQFRSLDKAAIVTEKDKQGRSSNPWRICTVHQVEELKLLIRILPIWGSGTIVFAAWAQQGTFFLQEGNTLDRRIRGFEIPAGSMSVFPTLALLISVPIYDKLAIPAMRRITGHPRGITSLQRMGVGLVISVFIMLTAGFVEVKRRHAAAAAGLLDLPKSRIPMSVFWMLPQYLLIGFMELFLNIGQLEFFYEQSPESMRSMATAIFWAVIAAGNYISTVLVTAIRCSRNGWIVDNINRGHLEYFYWLLAAMLLANVFFFLLAAHWYRYKKWNDDEEQPAVLRVDKQDHPPASDAAPVSADGRNVE